MTDKPRKIPVQSAAHGKRIVSINAVNASSEVQRNSNSDGFVAIKDAISSKRVGVSERIVAIDRDNITRGVYAYLRKKTDASRRPQLLTIQEMATACRCTYDQVRYRLKYLEKYGLLEKWTVKHPTKFKVTYYRLTGI